MKPIPVTADILYGNEALKSTLNGFAKKKAFPNAFMISGPEGSGKTTAALLFAMAIACKSGNAPCGSCSSCRKISEGISPDIITIALPEDRKTIGIESSRLITDTAHIMPNDLDVKVYIIKDAEKMTEPAQNALLKIFEEGPSGVYFILLTSLPSRLLPTVRSRAPEIKTEVFSDKALSELLLSHSDKARDLNKRDTAAFKRTVSASDGSYGKALSILGGKNKKASKMIAKAEELVSVLSEKDSSRLLLTLLGEADDRESYASVLRLTQNALRDLVAAKKCDDCELVFYSDRGLAEETAKRFSLNTLSALASALDTLSHDVTKTNINLRNAAIVASGRLSDIL